MAASPGECDPAGTLYDSTGTGRLLSGSILSADLDAVASVNGATAEVDATTPPSDEETNPLSAGVLNAVQLNLTGLADTLSDLLNFNTDTGVLNQYGYANQDGTVRGASGAVADDGSIRLEPSDGWPELASLDLHTVVSQIGGSGTADLLSAVTDAELSIGAVAGRTQFSSLCNPPADLERDYLVSYLKAELTSPTVGATVGTINGTLSGLTSGLVNTLNSLTVVNALLRVDSLSLSLDTAELPAGAGRPVKLALSNPAVVTVDLGALLGGAYEGTTASPWLNSLAPNTRLFTDAPLPTDALAREVGTLVDAVLGAIRVDIRVRGLLGLIPVTITGSLADLVSGNATVQPSLLGLTSAILSVIGTTIRDAILAAGALTPLTGALNLLLQGLFTVLTEVVVLTINAQNGEPGAVPDDLAALLDGQFDVAALHIGAVDAGGIDLLDVYLGRGSGGENLVRSA
ncbi:MAG: choice-of-anchor G family protein [Dermabacteraceae bacterium]